MGHTVFDVQVRTTECRACGAPVATTAQGGQVTCEYCGATNVISVRSAASGAGVKPSMADEVARLTRLKAQLEHPIGGHAYDLDRPPLGWTFEELETTAGRARLSYEWAQAKASTTPSTPEEQRKLCWLAMKIADIHRRSGEQLKARAVLETALGLLEDEGHRHLVRCRLATEAIEEGDLPSAEGWLAECDPAPEVLGLDSAYRTALAFLRARQGRASETLAVTGMQYEDIPVDPAFQRGIAQLRVHALEQAGHQAHADAELLRAMNEYGDESALSGLADLRLAPKTLQRAQRYKLKNRLQSLVEERAKLGQSLLAAAAPTLGFLPILALLLLVPVGIVRCTADADPLLGVYGYALCPRVCDDCNGRVRVVTVWHGGGGEYTSDGAQYFCPAPSNQVDKLTRAQLEAAADRGFLDSWELSWLAAIGASFLIVLALIFPLVIVNAIRRRIKDARAEAALNEKIAQVAAQLGAQPPTREVQSYRGLVQAIAFNALMVGVAALLVVIGLAIS